MKRFSLLGLMIALSVALCSCGGGGGGGNGSGGSAVSYPVTTNIFKIYKGGETLIYDYSYSAKYDDGSGAVSSSGTETQNIYSGWSNSEISSLYKLVINQQPNTGVSVTVEDFYFYDASNNLIRYSTNNHYSNESNSTTGSLIMPSVLNVGFGWSNTTYLKQFNGTDYYGTVNYTVVSKGTVSVPMGNVEAYKITYTGDMVSGRYTLKYNGEYFANPSIGIIKTVETGIEHQWWDYNYSYTSSLQSINWTN